MSTTKSLRSIITLSLALSVLLGYSFISAWTAPTGTAPANNVPAPINVATSTGSLQSGYGTLVFDRLVSIGDTEINGQGRVIGTAPQIEFDDTDADNNKWWIHSNTGYGGTTGGRMHFLYDRNDSSGWDVGDGDVSMMIESGSNPNNDFLYFPGKVRATLYCDKSGVNCIDPNSTQTTVGGVCFEPRFLVKCNWNWSGSGNDDSSYTISIATDPVAYCASVGRTYTSHDTILATCNTTTNYLYSWDISYGTCYTSSSGCGYAEPGTQTNGVACRRSDGAVVADSFCTSPKPPTTQACTVDRHNTGSCR